MTKRENPEEDLDTRLTNKMKELEDRLDDTLSETMQRAEERVDQLLGRCLPDGNAIEEEFDRRVEQRLGRVFSHTKGHRPARHMPEGGTKPTVRVGRPTIHVGDYKIDLYDDRSLHIIDDLMCDLFHLHKYLKDADLHYPTVYCETMDEFYSVFLIDSDVSESTRQQWLKELRAEAEDLAPGGIFGVNLPGKGCYVNGWLYAYDRAENARAALRDPEIYPLIVETVAHEKLGHGFLAEHSAMGQEKTQLGLWRHDIANRFDTRGPDTPRYRLLAAKHNILHHSSTFAEEGWSNWIEHYVATQFASAITDSAVAFNYHPSPCPTLTDLQQVLTRIANLEAELREPATCVLDALDTLFPSARESIDLGEIHLAAIEMQRNANTLADAIASKLGQPLPYVLGQLLVDKIANACGDICVPYAILIATNVTYDLEEISIVDLQNLTTQDTRLNINSRLAQMTFLSPARKDDVAEMARLAKEHLNFSTPANFKLKD